MDKRKESERLRKLAQMYALGELAYQEYREQRGVIIDYCQGLISEIPEPEETPVNAMESDVDRVDSEVTAMRSRPAFVNKEYNAKKRLWGKLMIFVMLVIGVYVVVSVYR
jgi:hypothetical protein